jgi:hypothetical protein
VPRWSLRSAVRRGLDNRAFWNERYLTNSELGSVLDVGFGDLHVLGLSVSKPLAA